MARKFLYVATAGAQPQYLTVDEDEVSAITDQFENETTLAVTDQKDGRTVLFNMGRVAFVSIQDHNDG